MINKKEYLLVNKAIKRRKKNLEFPILYSVALPIGIIAGYQGGDLDNAHTFYSFMLALTIGVAGAAIERLSKPIYTGNHEKYDQ